METSYGYQYQGHPSFLDCCSMGSQNPLFCILAQDLIFQQRCVVVGEQKNTKIHACMHGCLYVCLPRETHSTVPTRVHRDGRFAPARAPLDRARTSGSHIGFPYPSPPLRFTFTHTHTLATPPTIPHPRKRTLTACPCDDVDARRVRYRH